MILIHFLMQSLCTGVFLSSLFEFIMLHKAQWYAFLQRHCKSDEVTLETGQTGVPDDNTSPTEPGQFQMSEIAAIGTIGAYIVHLVSCIYTCILVCMFPRVSVIFFEYLNRLLIP